LGSQGRSGTISRRSGTPTYAAQLGSNR
jgi:hypothetical protein